MLTLISLDYLGSPTTSMDVARLMRFDPATTTRAASILTNEAFILPSSGHKSDDRKKPLVLSEKGIEAVVEYKNLMASKAEHAKSLLDLDGSYDEVIKQLGTLSFLANRTEILASLKLGQLT
jgi:DNA-binding MarR family transcriptional regulator